MKYNIEKNVPIPRKRGGAFKSGLRQAFREFSVGDSLFMVKSANTVRATAFLIAKETGFKFTVRSVEENGVRGVRVWRIS